MSPFAKICREWQRTKRKRAQAKGQGAKEEETGQEAKLREGKHQTWYNALLYCSLGCIQGICHSVLLLPYFYFAAATDLQDSYTTTQFGQTLL